MKSPLDFSRVPKTIVVGLLIINIIIIAVLGLYPKGFSTKNQVSRIPGSPGIKFEKQGIAFTDPFSFTQQRGMSHPGEISFEIALHPESFKTDGFNFILALHSGKDSDQLLFGQWQSHFIVMNGDDYSNKRRLKRISFNAAALPNTTLFVTVTAGKNGTVIYVNGRAIRSQSDFSLKLPNLSRAPRLTIGNSVYGHNSWRGAIYGLAIYRHELSKQAVEHHYQNWAQGHTFAFAKQANPMCLYLFDEGSGSSVWDHSGLHHHLYMPTTMQVLKRKFLSFSQEKGWSGWLNADRILNLIGFIPLGILLSAALLSPHQAVEGMHIVKTVFLCFLLSLFLETVQAWLPSRSSDMADLILNTFGSFIGAVVFGLLSRKSSQGMQG